MSRVVTRQNDVIFSRRTQLAESVMSMLSPGSIPRLSANLELRVYLNPCGTRRSSPAGSSCFRHRTAHLFGATGESRTGKPLIVARMRTGAGVVGVRVLRFSGLQDPGSPLDQSILSGPMTGRASMSIVTAVLRASTSFDRAESLAAGAASMNSSIPFAVDADPVEGIPLVPDGPAGGAIAPLIDASILPLEFIVPYFPRTAVGAVEPCPVSCDPLPYIQRCQFLFRFGHDRLLYWRPQ